MEDKTLLTQNNNHVFVSGQTRSGKTYWTSRALEQLSRPVLFFNLQDETLPRKFVTINQADITGPDLVESLRKGMKIDLRLPDSMVRINDVEAYVTQKLMVAGFSESSPVYLAFDDCHLLKDRGLEMAIQAATRGLKRGVRCLFITQRPALCNKTLYTQSAEQVLFYIAASEKEYLRNKGLDYEECKQHWESLGKYSYLYYDGFTLEGRRAI